MTGKLWCYALAAKVRGATLSDIEKGTPGPKSPERRVSGRAMLLLHLSGHETIVLGAAACALLGTGCALALPLLAKAILDALDSGASLSVPVLLFLAVTVLSALFNFLQTYLLGIVGEGVVYQARRSLVRAHLYAKMAALRGKSSGKLATQATADTGLLREAASNSLIGFGNAIILIVGTLSLMAVLDIMLFSVAVVAVLIIGIVFRQLMPRLVEAGTKAQESVARFGGQFEADLRAIRTIKAARAEDFVARRLDSDAEVARSSGVSASLTSAISWSAATSGIRIALMMVLGVGAWRVSQGAMPLSTLVAFLLYTVVLADPVMELSHHITTLQSGIVAARRLRSAIDLPREVTIPAHVVPVDIVGNGPRGLIEIHDVSYTADGVENPIIGHVTMTIPKVGHIAIVGPSGAGKTTILSLILKLDEPTSGQLYFDSQPYVRVGSGAIRDSICYVEQDSPALPGTVRDNLTLGHAEVSDSEIFAALDKVGLAEVVARLPGQLDSDYLASGLSGGQRQRISLARAFLRPSRLLILDEATAQIDTATESRIVAVIRELAQNQAVLTVAHRLSTVQHAETIFLMEAGGLRARGTHSELLASDRLYTDLVSAAHISGSTFGYHQ